MGDFLKNCTLWVLTQILRFKSANDSEQIGNVVNVHDMYLFLNLFIVFPV